jgi:hypothetical protein
MTSRGFAITLRMKFAVLLLTLFVAPLVAQDRRGFEGIQFGLSRDETRAALIEKLKFQPVQGFAGQDLRGPGGMRLSDGGEAIIVQGYKLDGVRADVFLYFNANGRFSRVEYEASRRPASYFQSQIRNDAMAFSKTFQKSFGSPTFRMDPKLVEMRPGSRNYYWRWTKGKETIYTAVVAGDDDFGAIAVIGDDALLREPKLAVPPSVADVTPPVEEPAVVEASSDTALPADTTAAAEPAPTEAVPPVPAEPAPAAVP